MIVNDNKNIFSKSFEILEFLSKDNEIKEILNDNYLNAVFIHQLVFSAVIINNYSKPDIGFLANGVNYPLHLFDEDKNKPQISQLISFRYDNYFNEEYNDNIPRKLIDVKDKLSMIWYYK